MAKKTSKKSSKKTAKKVAKKPVKKFQPKEIIPKVDPTKIFAKGNMGVNSFPIGLETFMRDTYSNIVNASIRLLKAIDDNNPGSFYDADNVLRAEINKARPNSVKPFGLFPIQITEPAMPIITAPDSIDIDGEGLLESLRINQGGYHNTPGVSDKPHSVVTEGSLPAVSQENTSMQEILNIAARAKELGGHGIIVVDAGNRASTLEDDLMKLVAKSIDSMLGTNLYAKVEELQAKRNKA